MCVCVCVCGGGGGGGMVSTVTNKNVHPSPLNEFSTSLTCQNVDVT